MKEDLGSGHISWWIYFPSLLVAILQIPMEINIAKISYQYKKVYILQCALWNLVTLTWYIFPALGDSVEVLRKQTAQELKEARIKYKQERKYDIYFRWWYSRNIWHNFIKNELIWIPHILR